MAKSNCVLFVSIESFEREKFVNAKLFINHVIVVPVPLFIVHLFLWFFFSVKKKRRMFIVFSWIFMFVTKRWNRKRKRRRAKKKWKCYLLCVVKIQLISPNSVSFKAKDIRKHFRFYKLLDFSLFRVPCRKWIMFNRMKSCRSACCNMLYYNCKYWICSICTQCSIVYTRTYTNTSLYLYCR